MRVGAYAVHRKPLEPARHANFGKCSGGANRGAANAYTQRRVSDKVTGPSERVSAAAGSDTRTLHRRPHERQSRAQRSTPEDSNKVFFCTVESDPYRSWHKTLPTTIRIGTLGLSYLSGNWPGSKPDMPNAKPPGLEPSGGRNQRVGN